MLEYLSKKDKHWREIAENICKDKDLANDIVQDMYLKLMNVDKDINDWYVIKTIKTLFLDHCRQKNKTIPLTSLFYLQDQTKIFEPNDEEYEILLKAKEIEWHKQELLEESYDRSLRAIEKEYNINYGFIFRELEKARIFILGDDFDKQYNNKRLKNGK